MQGFGCFVHAVFVSTRAVDVLVVVSIVGAVVASIRTTQQRPHQFTFTANRLVQPCQHITHEPHWVALLVFHGLRDAARPAFGD
jgi:hypothetical protein